ncbi:hypothetical protein D0U04_18185 [Bacillus clarus]|uniref:Uncharacterized protein n=1 Tax=Bacillus clarus TaxID=2338372 RepID=A0ABX9KSY3_9BACI|nr:hypothetical protein D0U04_18185 [Bacillus clarus]
MSVYHPYYTPYTYDEGIANRTTSPNLDLYRAGYQAGYQAGRYVGEETTIRQSYPLVVRGGGGLSFSVHPGTEQGEFNILELFFRGGQRPATLGLAPGEGSWVDRGLRENEPTIIHQWVPAGVTSARWFNDLRDPNKYWTFYVYNTGQGVMRVTHSHSGKPF